MKYTAAELIYNISNVQMWQLPLGNYEVEFDDGLVTMTRNQLITSWYYWEMYRQFPGKPLIKATAITEYYTTATHIRLGGILVWHIYNHRRANDSINLLWDISKVYYEVTNILYNLTCTHMSEYVTGGSLHDLIEILEEPGIVAAKKVYTQVCEETNYDTALVSAEIKKVHDVVERVLYTDPNYLPSNNIKKLTLMGLVSKGQIIQMIGPRGYVQDIDGSVFNYPINTGYAEGMYNLYDAATESRSASRASLMNDEPLKQSQWWQRKSELCAGVINDVVQLSGGCTGFVTIPYLVEEEDEVLLRGKYHMVDNQAVLIWHDIAPLVGTTIQMRSITGCGHTDVQSVCSVCLGWSSNIIPRRVTDSSDMSWNAPLNFTSLGFALTVPLCAVIAQIMLSTKHYEKSSVLNRVELNAIISAWLAVHSKQMDKLYLNEKYCRSNILIRLDSDSVKQLAQIMHVDVSELPPSRLSKITEFAITNVDREGNMIGPFQQVSLASVSKTGVHLSSQVLSYIKKHSWVTGKGYIEFTLKNWPVAAPLFLIPRKGDDIMNFFNTIKLFLEPDKNSESKITDCRTRGRAISEFIAILRRKMNRDSGLQFNMIQVEIFIRSLMVVDYANKDFRLPHPSQPFQFIGSKQALMSRSLTAMLISHGQSAGLLHSHWRMNHQVTTHLLDPLFDRT